MNIIEVMNSLQIEVGYARRPCWKEEEILVRHNDENIEIVDVHAPYPNNEAIYEFTVSDLLADDWIVVDGKE
jgi:hypothetical protein